MYNSAGRQYILKQTSGKVWNLYYDERAGICYSILSKRGTWSEPVSLHKQGFPKFFATMDRDDNIYILFQDRQGNIFMSTLENSSMKTYPILNSKSPSAYDKHFYLIPQRNTVHMLFVLKHNNQYILSHQTLAGGAVSVPKVVDYVPDSMHPYSAVCDNTSGIYVFYPASDGHFTQLGYKKYMLAQKFWGEFNPITRCKGNCSFPEALINPEGIIHISYQRKQDNMYELVYQQKIPERNLWADEVLLHRSSYPFENSSLVCMENSIFVFWVREDIIYYTYSGNGGNSWPKPARYSFVSGRQLLCMQYSANGTDGHENFIAKDVPGSFVNGLRVAFLEDTASRHEPVTPEVLRDMFADSLKLLKADVEDLRDSDMSLKEIISGLKTSLSGMSRDTVKDQVRLGLLENRLNALEHEMEQLKTIIKKYGAQDTESKNNPGE